MLDIDETVGRRILRCAFRILRLCVAILDLSGECGGAQTYIDQSFSGFLLFLGAKRARRTNPHDRSSRISLYKDDETVLALLKVTNKEVDAPFDIVLPPPGECTSKFVDDIGADRPCYTVQLRENNRPVAEVHERILDNLLNESLVLLSYKSAIPRYSGSHKVRIRIGTAGFYNDNVDIAFDLDLVLRQEIAQERPYALLQSDADRDVNMLYKTKLRSMGSARGAVLKEDERRWISDKDRDCGSDNTEQAERCRWMKTSVRIQELKGW